ncbi:MAG: hypothetical protein SXQ77_08855, partial [Halobacteria archaeon]|nr:hypothetical protein [Halobacteria archaeon]
VATCGQDVALWGTEMASATIQGLRITKDINFTFAGNQHTARLYINQTSKNPISLSNIQMTMSELEADTLKIQNQVMKERAPSTGGNGGAASSVGNPSEASFLIEGSVVNMTNAVTRTHYLSAGTITLQNAQIGIIYNPSTPQGAPTSAFNDGNCEPL